MLGIVIDENQPEYERGDFLVRPIVGADPEQGCGRDRRARSGSARPSACTSATRPRPTRTCARRSRRRAPRSASTGAAGRALFTCNGRGSHMFDAARPRRDRDRGRARRSRRRLLLRRRDRPGRRPQLPARVHGDAGGLPARVSERSADDLVARALAEDLGARRRRPPRRSSRPTRGRGRGSCRRRPASSSASTPPRRRSARPGAESFDRDRGRGPVARRACPRAGRLRLRPGPGAARRRAHRAQLPRPPLRRRDADRALRRGRGRGHRRARSSTPARRPRACARSRRRRSPPAAAATTAWASTTRS